MAKRSYTAEEIVTVLRQVEVARQGRCQTRPTLLSVKKFRLSFRESITFASGWPELDARLTR
jgi:hypothetical protein